MRAYIEHATVTVADIEWSAKFFEDVLGMKETRRKEKDGHITMLWLDGGVQLCRVEAQAADTGRVGHIAFKTDDLDGLLDRAARYGAEAVPGKPRHWFRCLGITFEMK